MSHHAMAAPAGQFLEIVRQDIDREGDCQQFLHPEIRALEDLCIGRGLDVGCGSSKTTPKCIGVDIVPAGVEGGVGSETGRISVADVTATGDDLPMFADGSLDFIVVRHNLEHDHDPRKTWHEWTRVVRSGGRIGVVVPDHHSVNTYDLDPTHDCHFTRASLEQIASEVSGLKLCKVEPCIPNWSLLGVFETTD